MPINSRAKGAAGEREFARWLTERGFPASRGVQFQGGPDSPDVRCTMLPIHFEVKRVQAFNVWKALAQAEGDCGDKIPVVSFRRNGGKWYAAIPMHSLIGLFTGRAQEKERIGLAFESESVDIMSPRAN